MVLLGLNILGYALLIGEHRTMSRSQTARVEEMDKNQNLTPLLKSNLIDIARYPSRSTRRALMVNILFSLLLGYNIILYLVKRKRSDSSRQ